MKKIYFIILGLLLSACGTIRSWDNIGYEKIYISTNVNNTTISTNGKIVTRYDEGYILADKGADGVFLTLSKTGYKDSSIYLQRSINPFILALDCILIFPIFIDLYTNEIFDFNPNNLTIFLTKENQ